MGVSLLTQVTRDGMRRSSLTLCQAMFTGVFRLDIKILFFFTTKAVKHWNRLPREVRKSPSLKIFKHMDVARGDMV